MSNRAFKYVFGPVHSRRLGKSLGVNNVPYKTCTYSCIYCQLGKTTNLTITRKHFYNPLEVIDEVCAVVSEASSAVDYVTFVPNGEPLLDANLGLELRAIKKRTGKPVAVLTNASLLFLEEARIDLAEADFVSVKVDAVREETWRAVNRPYSKLEFNSVLNGLVEFAGEYRKKLATESMLVEGFNTDEEDLELIAEFIRGLNPWKAYIAIPVRPPAEPYVKPPRPQRLLEAYRIFAEKLSEERVELLNMPEPPEHLVYGDPEKWLLNTVSVHPLRLDHAIRVLQRVVENPEELIENLKKRNEVDVVVYQGTEFIVRKYYGEKH